MEREWREKAKQYTAYVLSFHFRCLYPDTLLKLVLLLGVYVLVTTQDLTLATTGLKFQLVTLLFLVLPYRTLIVLNMYTFLFRYYCFLYKISVDKTVVQSSLELTK